MRRTRTVGSLVLLGLGLTAAACSSNVGGPTDGTGAPSASATAAGQDPEAVAPVSNRASIIDVRQDSRMSLSVQGALGPALQGETITKGVVSIDHVQLVGAGGQSVMLMESATTTDLLSIQNQLQQIVQQSSVQAGQYTSLRFHLASAYFETVDAQNVSHVYASEQVDTSQFQSVGSVSQLQLAGLDSNGYCDVAIPQGGIEVQGVASLAMHFSLAESLTTSGDTWVFNPNVWIADQSTFSSVSVQFQAQASFSQYIAQGFQVMLLDANMRPVCEAPLVATSSTVYEATFQYVASFEGPFVAVLLPPAGYSLSQQVAVSIDVQQSVSVETQIALSSVSVSSNTIVINAGANAICVQRGRNGQIVQQEERPIGTMDQVAPHTPPQEPVRPGGQKPAPAPTPQLPGVPPSHNEQGQGHGEPGADAGAPAPGHDAGGALPPEHDAGTAPPPEHDAGGAPPPQHDAGGAFPPEHDAGGGGGLPPVTDAGGGTPPQHDGGAGPSAGQSPHGGPSGPTTSGPSPQGGQPTSGGPQGASSQGPSQGGPTQGGAPSHPGGGPASASGPTQGGGGPTPGPGGSPRGGAGPTPGNVSQGDAGAHR